MTNSVVEAARAVVAQGHDRRRAGRASADAATVRDGDHRGRERSVARVVAPALTRPLWIVALLTAVCVLGLVLALRPVDHLIEQVWPAKAAQDQLAQDLGDLRNSALVPDGAGASADQASLDAQVSRIQADQATLSTAVTGDPELVDAVAAEVTAARRWTAAVTAPATVSPAPGVDRTARIARLNDLYGQYTSASARVAPLITARALEARQTATRRTWTTVGLVVLLLAASLTTTGLARRRLRRQVSLPLVGLADDVARMSRTEGLVLADETQGPREIRALARALNEYSAGQARARAVENRVADEIHQLDTVREELIANVSHELRTPLTLINGYLEIVSDEFEGSLDERHERMLGAMRRNVERLRLMVEDLLVLGHAEQDDEEIARLDLSRMVLDTVAELRLVARRRDISIDVEVPTGAMPVLAQRTLLRRALLNVLGNAVKFSHDGNHVAVLVTPLQDRVEVAIRDHGIGIPSAELERLGTRFFRASNAVDAELAGTGLGLRIVQSVIDQHNGDVVVESAQGRGTTVFVRLPLARDYQALAAR